MQEARVVVTLRLAADLLLLPRRSWESRHCLQHPRICPRRHHPHASSLSSSLSTSCPPLPSSPALLSIQIRIRAGVVLLILCPLLPPSCGPDATPPYSCCLLPFAIYPPTSASVPWGGNPCQSLSVPSQRDPPRQRRPNKGHGRSCCCGQWQRLLGEGQPPRRQHQC